MAAGAMQSIESWCHYYMGILSIGRTTNLPEGEEGAIKPKVPDAENEVQALAPVSTSDWSVQVLSRLGGVPVVVARSLRWPGANGACLQEEDKFTNLYIGYGHEATSTAFAVMPPPMIQQEPADLEEQQDPPLADENVLYKAAKQTEFEEAEEEAPADE